MIGLSHGTIARLAGHRLACSRIARMVEFTRSSSPPVIVEHGGRLIRAVVSKTRRATYQYATAAVEVRLIHRVGEARSPHPSRTLDRSPDGRYRCRYIAAVGPNRVQTHGSARPASADGRPRLFAALDARVRQVHRPHVPVAIARKQVRKFDCDETLRRELVVPRPDPVDVSTVDLDN